jgi:glycosyltransferase involved in cell wall biosynthesis
MNIAFIYPAPAAKDDDRILVKEAFGRRLQGLSAYFDKIYLFLPVDNKPRIEQTYPINQGNIIIHNLPMVGFLASWILVIPHTWAFLKIAKHVDVVYIGFPSLVAFPLWVVAKAFRKPTVLHVVGNVMGVVNAGKKWKGFFKQPPARLLAYLLQSASLLMARHSLVLTNGSELNQIYKRAALNSYTMVTSSLFSKELLIKERSGELHSPIRLLFVGALIDLKGIEYILYALKELTRKLKLEVELIIVGEGPRRDFLERVVNSNSQEDCVHFVGYVTPSDGLFEYFADSDIFILPTLSEGTPRVLSEAMGQGLPVIATSVGGIPDIIQDHINGLLIPPADSDAIVSAVLEIINNQDLRERLIKNSIQTAKKYTIDVQSKEMFEEIKNFLN